MPDMEHNLFCIGKYFDLRSPFKNRIKSNTNNNSYTLNLHEIFNSQTHQDVAG